jgi:hypothetical protein
MPASTSSSFLPVRRTLLISLFSNTLNIHRLYEVTVPLGWCSAPLDDAWYFGVRGKWWYHLYCSKFLWHVLFCSWSFRPRIWKNHLVSKRRAVVTQWRGALIPEDGDPYSNCEKLKPLICSPYFPFDMDENVSLLQQEMSFFSARVYCSRVPATVVECKYWNVVCMPVSYFSGIRCPSHITYLLHGAESFLKI